jgi:hypothetical protein
MKPCTCGLLLLPADVGRGGNEEVKVVARRVGLKRREDDYQRGLEYDFSEQKRDNMNFALPD